MFKRDYEDKRIEKAENKEIRRFYQELKTEEENRGLRKIMYLLHAGKEE